MKLVVFKVFHFSYLVYILGCVVLYDKKELWNTHKHITINPPYNQRVKRVLYTIYQ